MDTNTKLDNAFGIDVGKKFILGGSYGLQKALYYVGKVNKLPNCDDNIKGIIKSKLEKIKTMLNDSGAKIPINASIRTSVAVQDEITKNVTRIDAYVKHGNGGKASNEVDSDSQSVEVVEKPPKKKSKRSENQPQKKLKGTREDASQQNSL
ncbi:uncharacterized protein MELLADRAFT_113582 [Melampsora larici-populina 98AG31]|uniref:Uncharacterized protein n=1 Tax=Melampsora larici-populina (strain 98AG31 / pathotype 3-4-7) TaxID=747676 RepID=F4SAD6_MELLP|nr:uncharacterized protein MELLADRAFT_113582 [Melampsora larici-populina 98AG31]EGF98395.1 hypothetical protein MELLADRAFT_113582 [Melampsora larici-populina 98AG31]